jgi:hypothetical protein
VILVQFLVFKTLKSYDCDRTPVLSMGTDGGEKDRSFRVMPQWTFLIEQRPINEEKEDLDDEYKVCANTRRRISWYCGPGERSRGLTSQNRKLQGALHEI